MRKGREWGRERVKRVRRGKRESEEGEAREERKGGSREGKSVL